MNQQYFITGIGTEIGKTIVSAILTEKLNADYWKPIQSGELDDSDTKKIRTLISNKTSKFHPEAYQLQQPFSPHYSAHLDGVTIDMDEIVIPETQNHLIVEGAGGLMVPLNDKDLMIDLIQKLNLAVILVSKNYLGSINHTLLSIAALTSRNIPIKGLIFNGDANDSTEDIIQKRSNLKILGHIPDMEKMTPEMIKSAGAFIDL